MTRLYACTFAEKTVSDWSPTEGADPDSMQCTMQERCNITAKTLPELIRKIGDRYGLSMDDLFIPDDNENGRIGRIGFNQVETDDGSEPSESEIADWEAGELPLWLCDYEFLIEQRITRGIPMSEFKASDIKSH